MTVSKSSRTSHSELIGHARRWAEGCARKSGRAAHHEPLVSLSWPQRTSRASDPKKIVISRKVLDDFMVGRFCIPGPQKVCSSIGH
jgi:hypothetical protein